MENKHKYAMVIDLTRCVGCQSCTVSCKFENHAPKGFFRTWVSDHEIGRYPNTRREFLPQLCNQCDNPACVPVCPVKATWKDDNGVVVIDKSKCIGCGACVKACPYGDRFLDPVKKKADKCDFCFRRIEQGLQPACVETCVGGARIFGDLADPASQVSQLASSKDAKVLHDSIKYPPIDNRNDPPQLSKEVLSHAKKKEDHGLRCVQQWRIKNHDQTRRKSEDPAPDTR